MVKEKEMIVKVKFGKPSDKGKGIARLSYDVCSALGVDTGDLIKIKGTKETVAKIIPLTNDSNKVILLDSEIRDNAGISIDEEVTVERASDSNINVVEFALLEMDEKNKESLKQIAKQKNDLANFLSSELVHRPLMEGDILYISVPIAMRTQMDFFSQTETRYWTLPFKVLKMEPKYGVIRHDTKISVSDKLASPTSKEKVKTIRYEDIGGLKNEIEAIREMVEVPMKNPEVFRRLGVDPPKGVLLYGPPGTGKTLLAKAVASETSAHFITLNGPEIMSKYYGQSEENLRKIFDDAKASAPTIIFIDEIDAIAPNRNEVQGEVERRVVSQLLTLMDGLEARGNIIVMASTNRPDSLDPALRRPGRFDREIVIGMPNREARKEIIQIHTRNMPLHKDVNIDDISDATIGYTGADVSALAKEAAMRALREVMPDLKKNEGKLSKEVLEKLEIRKEHFEDALSLVEPSAMREVSVEIPRVKWDDVGGLDDAKAVIKESAEWPLLHKELFEDIGISAPKGILLYGPPGTGKTLLAKAVANEARANFIVVKGPELLSKWVGESEKGIRQIFHKARQVAPAIIFFDEIDVLVPARGQGHDSGVGDKITAQLLTEMDGVSKLNNIMIMASTNRPDLLDKALLRPGRFDKLVFVDMPDKDGRKHIFKVHTKSMKLAVDPKEHDKLFDEFAKKTDGYSGADIESVCREAGMQAIREAIKKGKKKTDGVTKKHFEDTLEKVKASYVKEDKEKWKDIEQKMSEIVR